jgi:hypothetical protein
MRLHTAEQKEQAAEDMRLRRRLGLRGEIPLRRLPTRTIAAAADLAELAADWRKYSALYSDLHRIGRFQSCLDPERFSEARG